MNREHIKNLSNNGTIKEILKVASSNIAKLFAGVLVGFVLPKIIGVEDYGYYKTFTLYATYVGLFTFGFIDGIYLRYGGVSYIELNKKWFRLYSRFLILSQLFISIILITITNIFFAGEYIFIFSALSFYLLFMNITGYYQIVSQITSRFNELSLRNTILAILTAFQILIMWVLFTKNWEKFTYKSYVVVYVMIIGFLTGWYIFTYSDITFGKGITFKNNKNSIKKIIAEGFPLMLSNLCSSFILTLDRQFVSVIFSITTYAVYAFAYNMLSLVTTASSAISTVVYPKLKKYDTDRLIKEYPSFVSFIMIIMFGCLVLYYPLSLFVGWYLPRYIDSLQIFRIIFPGLAVSSTITIVIHNYYKVLGETNAYFKKTVIILITSAIANLIAYFIFRTTIAISIASIITMLIWYVYVDRFLRKKYLIKKNINFYYMISMMGLFYICTMKNAFLISFISFVVGFAIVTIFFYKIIAKAV